MTVSGLDDTTETPVAGDDTATVTDRITVTPPEATCTAAPAGAQVTTPGPTLRTARWVSLDVPADTTTAVTVTCTHHGAQAAATADFTANPAPDTNECDDPLGTLAATNPTRHGTLSADTGCRSLGRYGFTGSRGHYAARHTFRMPAAGWITIDLENTGTGRNYIDTYLVLINGNNPNGGTVLERNDDSGRNYNSRITHKLLQPGNYTIEATTYSRRDHGTYQLTITTDYTTKITATAAHAKLRVQKRRHHHTQLDLPAHQRPRNDRIHLPRRAQGQSHRRHRQRHPDRNPQQSRHIRRLRRPLQRRNHQKPAHPHHLILPPTPNRTPIRLRHTTDET